MTSTISTKVCNDVKEKLEEFADITSLHGVPRIINSPSVYHRIFWSMVFILAVCMFIFTGSNLLSMYFSYPKKVNVEIIQTPVPFPSVTVCNTEHLDLLMVDKMYKMFNTEADASNPEMKRLRKKQKNTQKATQSSMDIDEDKYDYKKNNVKHERNQRDNRDKRKDKKRNKNTLDFLEKYSIFQSTLSVLMQTASLGSGSGGVDMKDVFELMSRLGLVANVGPMLSSRAGVRAKDFIVYCRFMEEECNITETFVNIFDPYFFNCFTFEPSHKVQSTRLAGIEHGLSLLLFPGSAGMNSKNSGENKMTMIPGMIEADAALATNQGSKVVIHSRGSIAHFTTESIDLPSGSSVSVGIRARLNVRVPLPHGNCTEEEKEEDGSSRPDKAFKYTLISCQNQCIQSNIAKSCGCVDSRLPYREEELTKHHRNYLKHRNNLNIDLPLFPNPLYNRSSHKQTSSYMPFCLELPAIPARCRRADSMSESGDCWEIIKRMAKDFNSRTKCRKVVYDRMTLKQPELIEACRCYPPCQDVSYEAHHTLSQLPQNFNQNSAFYSVVDRYLESLSTERRKALENIYGSKYEDEVKRMICRVNVYIADNNIIKTTESPDYDAVRLISDIGGQMGLWIGISVITLVEVVQLLLDLCGVLSSASKKLWRFSFNEHVEEDNDKTTKTDRPLRNNSENVIFNQLDANYCDKKGSCSEDWHGNRTKERYSSGETTQSNEYFLNKLTTV